jgi:8-oxo-dGTP pyrophosphatase MutT (NUDIX family)
VATTSAADPQFWQRRIAERLRGSTARHERADWVLPGLTAEASHAFEAFVPEKLIPAAVLMPIILREPSPTVLFTQRASALKNHAGQISFPGGRLETSDGSPIAAALREAQEEVGLDPAFVTVIGFLPDHIIGSGFRVTPVVAFVRPGFSLTPDEREVQETFEVPLDFLFDPANFRPRLRQYVPDLPPVQLNDIPVGERNIWGATAGMLISLYRLCKE